MNAARLFLALEFAAYKHRHQRRKSGDQAPYINHPITVARILANVGGVHDEDVLIAAVLHDTIEDTETTREELIAAFGTRVCEYVEEVTDDKSLPKAERKLRQISHARELSPGATLIKIADKTANCGDLTHSPPADWSKDRLLEYLDWAEKVVSQCATVNEAMLTRFRAVVAEGRRLLG